MRQRFRDDARYGGVLERVVDQRAGCLRSRARCPGRPRRSNSRSRPFHPARARPCTRRFPPRAASGPAPDGEGSTTYSTGPPQGLARDGGSSTGSTGASLRGGGQGFAISAPSSRANSSGCVSSARSIGSVAGIKCHAFGLELHPLLPVSTASADPTLNLRGTRSCAPPHPARFYVLSAGFAPLASPPHRLDVPARRLHETNAVPPRARPCMRAAPRHNPLERRTSRARGRRGERRERLTPFPGSGRGTATWTGRWGSRDAAQPRGRYGRNGARSPPH